jgi:uncharacterized membrane protein YedE/YeeE
MTEFTPFSALAGGALIGLSAVLLLLFNGRVAGISGILNGTLYAKKTDKLWRVLFLAGLIIGALIFQLAFPQFNSPRTAYPLGLLILGGFLVGLGARLANGCVSGHGICGIGMLSKKSLIATVIFMLSGIITVFITRHLIG